MQVACWQVSYTLIIHCAALENYLKGSNKQRGGNNCWWIQTAGPESFQSGFPNMNDPKFVPNQKELYFSFLWGLSSMIL